MKTLLVFLLATLTFTLKVTCQDYCQTCEQDLDSCLGVCQNTSDLIPCGECLITASQPCCECVFSDSPYSSYCNVLVTELVSNMKNMHDDSNCVTCGSDLALCLGVCSQDNPFGCFSCLTDAFSPCCSCFFPSSQYCGEYKQSKQRTSFQK